MRSAILGLVALLACGEAEAPRLPEAKDGAYGPALSVTSPAFLDGDAIPAMFTCDGDDVSPALLWSEGPAGTTGFALVVDDPDAPTKVWVHWVAWGIDGERRALPQGVAADDPSIVQGTNDSGELGWSGPCPPARHGPHDYEFHVFAVDETPQLPSSTTRDELYRALDGHALAMGVLVGTYDR